MELQKHINIFRIVILIIALTIQLFLFCDFENISLFSGVTIWLMLPYIILVFLNIFFKKLTLLLSAAIPMLGFASYVYLTSDFSSSSTGSLIFIWLPIWQLFLILPIGLFFGFILVRIMQSKRFVRKKIRKQK